MIWITTFEYYLLFRLMCWNALFDFIYWIVRINIIDVLKCFIWFNLLNCSYKYKYSASSLSGTIFPILFIICFCRDITNDIPLLLSIPIVHPGIDYSYSDAITQLYTHDRSGVCNLQKSTILAQTIVDSLWDTKLSIAQTVTLPFGNGEPLLLILLFF